MGSYKKLAIFTSPQCGIDPEKDTFGYHKTFKRRGTPPIANVLLAVAILPSMFALCFIITLNPYANY
jgi:hypothetical protein